MRKARATFLRPLRALAFCAAAAAALHAQSFNEKPTIPQGVRYKFASDELNDSAKALLQKALAGDQMASQQVLSSVSCGPMLWQALKPAASATLQNAKPITFVLPVPAAITTEGRGFVTDETRKAFWSELMRKYPELATANVRKPTSAEISYYWATIPFDIEEPLFALDAGPNVFVVNLRNEDGKTHLFWIDIVGDLHTLKDEKPTNKTTKMITDKLSDDAERQDPATMERAGTAYLTGNGVPTNVERGRELLDAAAQKGSLGAQMFLGSAYFSGKYLPQDRAKAAPYLLMAADQGNALAQFFVGTMYINGVGLGKSVEKARHYFERASDQNFAGAQYNLGAIYFQGIGIPADKARACALYSKAADQGHLEATNDLAWCYQRGEGMDKDLAKAKALYLKAANAGHLRSQGNLAVMYGADGEWQEAYTWLRIAENAGGAGARPAIEDAKKHLSPAQIDQCEGKVVEWQKSHPRKQ